MNVPPNHRETWSSDFDEAAALVCALPERFMFDMCDLDSNKPIISSSLDKSITDDLRDNAKQHWIGELDKLLKFLRSVDPASVDINPRTPMSAKELIFSRFADQSQDEIFSPFQHRRTSFENVRSSLASSDDDEEIRDLSNTAINFYANKYADYVTGMETYMRVASYALLRGKTLEDAVEDGHLALAPVSMEHVTEAHGEGVPFRRVIRIPAYMKRIAS